MAVADAYQTAATLVVSWIDSYFQEAGLQVEVAYGPRAIARQTNKGPEGRVVVTLEGGSYEGPHKMGSRSREVGEHNAYTLHAEMEAHLWAWDDTAPEDDLAQEAAWFRLHEYTLAALRAEQQGRFRPLRLSPSRGPIEIRHGIARVLSFEVQVPVQYPPDAVPKLALSAAVTIAQKHVQGSENGEEIPAIVTPITTLTLP